MRASSSKNKGMQGPVPSQASAPPSAEVEHGDSATEYVIDLLTIRISAGVLWGRMRDTISARLKAVLTRAAPGASFHLTGPDMTRCIVSLPHGDERGPIICVQAAYELILGLMGKCELSDIHVSRMVADPIRSQHPARFTTEELSRLLEGAKSGKAAAVPANCSNSPRGTPTVAPGTQNAPSPAARARTLTAQYAFEPIWDAQAQAVCMYLCSARDICEEGGAHVARQDLTLKERAAIEFEGALTGIGQLVTQIERGDRFLLNLPFSFETLASPSCRTELTQICRGILPVYRPYLIFTLTDVPNGVSAARLSDFIMLLRPFARVTAVVADGERNHFAFLNVGLSGLAADLARNNRRSDILMLAASARNFKLGATLYHVEDPEIVQYAHAADVRLFHGPVIGKPLDEPRRMTHLPLTQVLPAAENAGEEEWF